MWHLADISSVAITQLRTLVMIRILSTLALCLTLLTPGIATAKKPNPGRVACALLLETDPAVVYTGMPFTVRLVRIPSYPGAFRNPTVSIDVSYPANDGEITQNDTRTIHAFNVTYVNVGFVVPLKSSGIEIGGEATIAATVTEGHKSKKIRCMTNAMVQESM
jgi:hypothetical protein